MKCQKFEKWCSYALLPLCGKARKYVTEVVECPGARLFYEDVFHCEWYLELLTIKELDDEIGLVEYAIEHFTKEMEVSLGELRYIEFDLKREREVRSGKKSRRDDGGGVEGGVTEDKAGEVREGESEESRSEREEGEFV